MGVLIDTEIEYKDGTFEKFTITKTDSVEKIIASKILKGDQVMHVRQTRSMAEAFAKRMVSKLGGKYFDESIELPIKIGDKELELDRCIKYGVAWHHAGISAENRSYIEENFKEGKIRFICATTTLGAGINIPARDVFLEWKRFNGFGSEPLKVLEVLQILHRAGRPQFDDEGFGILVCKDEEDYDYCINEYFAARPEPVKSCLTRDASYLFHSMIGNMERAKTRDEMLALYKNSFAHHENPRETRSRMEAVMSTFKNASVPIVVEKDGVFTLTELGTLVKRYYVNPGDAVIIAGMIQKSDDLSMIAMVHAILRCDTMFPMRVKGNDDEWRDRLAEIKPSLYYKDFNVNDDKEWKAFQTTCVLMGTGKENETKYTDENTAAGQLCYVYGIQSGDLQRTVGSQGNMSWLLGFAESVARMYKKWNIARKIDDLDVMLRYGISDKLVPICRVRNIGKERGKALFTVGYCDVESIATANPGDIAEVKVNDKKMGIKVAESIVHAAGLLLKK
jgi:helicase